MVRLAVNLANRCDVRPLMNASAQLMTSHVPGVRSGPLPCKGTVWIAPAKVTTAFGELAVDLKRWR
eukprot:1184905-Prorocentrum_minimum.AAC.2